MNKLIPSPFFSLCVFFAVAHSHDFHAGQTGHSDFSESTDAVKALTPEEKTAKLARMKELIAARRAARGEEEKVDHVKVNNS